MQRGVCRVHGGAGSASREQMGHRGVQAVWGEKGRGCCEGDRRVQVYDRETRTGQAGDVEHRGMQEQWGWCQGQDEGHTLTRVCSSESPVSAAMRHSVVGSGCLFTLQKWYSRISSCSSVGITGFSMAISSWGRAMGPGTAERGWCHCSSWEWPVGPHLLSPRFAIRVHTNLLPPPRLWPLAAAGLNSLPKDMPGSSAGSTSPPATPVSVSSLQRPHSSSAQR